MRYEKETEVYYNDPLRGGRILYYGGEREKSAGKHVTELGAEWSPKGTFMATFHSSGIVIWGGSQMQKVWRLAHENVKQISFSPDELFLITRNDEEEQSANESVEFVWNLVTGIKTIVLSATEHSWKWSFNGKYLARLVVNGIEIIDTETFNALEGGPIAVQGIVEFAWSPAANVLSYWVPEIGNSPARVVVMAIPNKTVVRDKHLVFVTTLSMTWQNQGAFLIVQATRQNAKTKKPMPFMLDIFSLLEKNVPVDSVEIKDEIDDLVFELNGSRFAVLTHKIDDIDTRHNCTIFSLINKKFVVDTTLTSRTATKLSWSPNGGVLLLMTLAAGEKNMELYDVGKKESIFLEHPLATEYRVFLVCFVMYCRLGFKWKVFDFGSNTAFCIGHHEAAN